MLDNDSILNSIKKEVGLFQEDKSFDTSIVMNINNAFMILNSLGVGPKKPFFITGDEESWFEFSSDISLMNSVKAYVWIKTKLNFDPPETSFGVTALEKQANELEWRLCSQMKDVDDD